MDAAEPTPVSRAVPQSLVFVDLETTGGNPAYHRITEVGIIRLQDGVEVEEWSSLVNPECSIPSYIESFTGISNAMVSCAPRFAELAATIFEKLQGAIFVAHNARFDYGFLRAEFLREKITFAADVMCTVKLSRRLFPQFPRHNLDAVMERHGLHCNARHRALGDARVIRDFWLKLQREVCEDSIGAAVSQSLLGVVKLPQHLPPGLADELPEGSGVYRYFGDDDVLLYVGRSPALRSHVLAQLGDSRSGSRDQKLSSETRRVDWVETPGELGSMLREAQWIRSQKPRYNRQLKGHEQSVTLRLREGGGRVEVRRFDELDAKELAHCFGVFNSAKDACKALVDIARARELCLKIIGLEACEGSCFAFQVGKCKGACTGSEPLMLHNMRVQLALSSLKIKSWPFPGRIALRERRRSGAGDGQAGAEYHVLDQWAYLGTARSEEEFESLTVRDAADAFDVDVYRILARHFANHPALDWRDLRDPSEAAS